MKFKIDRNSIQYRIQGLVFQALKSLGAGELVKKEEIIVEHPANDTFGDYATNVAMTAYGKIKNKILNIKNPLDLAKVLTEEIKKNNLAIKQFSNISFALPGFINFTLQKEYLIERAVELLTIKESCGQNKSLAGKKIMVEFAHPNTHKELHIGHMRTLILGETLSRIFAACGAEVFRANYQGDVGPHVAKSIWGTQKLMEERGLNWQKAEKMTLAEKAHLLGEGYVLGVKSYEDGEIKKGIDELNTKLYEKKAEILPVYERTRRWSLDYYNSFYQRFYVIFDRLFFESEVAEKGKENVLKHLGKVFRESEGAIVFEGEPYDLHTRVFITADGNPTYEGKEMGLCYLQYAAFPFDLNLHVVANEQTGYFKVAFKAMELMDPQFAGRQGHLPMGMVNLVGAKISSRTGVILKVDELLDEVKDLLRPIVDKGELKEEERKKALEIETIGAVKYSMLKTDPRMNVAFDIKESVSLEGNSGPYLQYTYARTQSVLAKANYQLPITNDDLRARNASHSDVGGKSKNQTPNKFSHISYPLSHTNISSEEMALLRSFYQFEEVIIESARQFSPHILCLYLFTLAQKFNLFYQKHRILTDNSQPTTDNRQLTTNNQKTNEEISNLQSQISNFRVFLTVVTAQILKTGLNLLGIEVLRKM